MVAGQNLNLSHIFCKFFSKFAISSPDILFLKPVPILMRESFWQFGTGQEGIVSKKRTNSKFSISQTLFLCYSFGRCILILEKACLVQKRWENVREKQL